MSDLQEQGRKAMKNLDKIKPNRVWHWIKKYWLVLVVAMALIIFIISRLIPAPKGKAEILKKAKKEATKAKNNAIKALEKHNKAMTERKAELKGIKAISDEEDRLKALARFANKHFSG